jgi:dihydroorotate dehydrogenase
MIDLCALLWPVLGPVLRRIEPERAHALAMAALRRDLVPAAMQADPAALKSRVWGRTFGNPLGLAAGFDKNAEAVRNLFRLGFGFVEIGTVTPRPQSGNPRPRLFRLIDDHGLINRLGFNGDGLAPVSQRLRGEAIVRRTAILGANVGPNRDSPDPVADCCAAAAALAPLADYLVVNVSSPNTPGLRQLQRREQLAELLARVRSAVETASVDVPLLLKIAPDVSHEEEEAIAHVALELRVDGIVATNTTVARPRFLVGSDASESGGLSGRPLFGRSTGVLARLYILTGGRIRLIGVGGVDSAAAAYTKIRAGASLVQLYTALIYQGPSLVQRIKRDLATLLARDGFTTVSEAVGVDAGRIAGLAG